MGTRWDVWLWQSAARGIEGGAYKRITKTKSGDDRISDGLYTQETICRGEIKALKKELGASK
jgi:hypothetical protein